MSSKRCDELMAAYMDGDLDDSSLAELEQLFVLDPQARSAFIRATRQEAHIRLIMRDHRAGRRAGAMTSTGRFLNESQQPSRHRPTWWGYRTASLAAAAAVLIFGLLVWFLLLPMPRLGVVTAANEASCVPGMILRAGDRIATTSNGAVSIVLSQGHMLQLAGNTSLIASRTQDLSFALGSGAIDVADDHLAASAPLVITTADAVATVEGTRFRIETSGGSTRLAVSDGVVRLTRLRDGASVRLSAGAKADTALAGMLCAEAAPVEGGSWAEVVSENFSLGRLSPIWSTSQGARPGGGGQELQSYRDDAFEFIDGAFALRAKRNGSPTKPSYTSGFISSSGRFAQTYGRFELRCRFPRGPGLVVYVRLLSDRHWPPEINARFDGSRPTQLNFDHHWPNADASGQKKTTTAFVGPDLTAEFHDLVCVWKPGIVSWYVDNTLAATNTEQVPDEPLFLAVNLAIGGTSRSEPGPETPFPAYFTLKTLRILQLKP